MKIRNTQFSDSAGVYELYKRVAFKPGGLARLEKEISTEYIEHFVRKSVDNGIGLVGFDNEGHLIGEIHAYHSGLYCFSHVLSDLTIAVDPNAQGQGVGRQLFEHFLSQINSRDDVLRVELMARESNKKAIRFYESLGFVIEGRFESRIKNIDGSYEADIAMAWVRV